jgi:hypothetical protein
MRKFWNYGGLVAAVVLIAFGTASIVMGFSGRDTVRDNLAAENISGSPDMTPAAIAKGAKEAGLENIALPTKAIAGEAVDTGSEARAFAEYMRVHALEATGGKTYAEMGRFATADGKGTNDEAAALKNEETGRPLDNPARQIWITETALSTALNTSYFAEQVALFSVIMGIALLLTGIGFAVMSLGLLPAYKARREEAAAERSTAVAAT